MPEFTIGDAPAPAPAKPAAPKFTIGDSPAAAPKFTIGDQPAESTGVMGALKDANAWANRQVQPITDTINRWLEPVRGGAEPGSLPPEAAAMRPTSRPTQPPEDPRANFEARAALQKRLKAEGKDPRQDPEFVRLSRGQAEQFRHENEVGAQFAIPLESGIAGVFRRAPRETAAADEGLRPETISGRVPREPTQPAAAEPTPEPQPAAAPRSRLRDSAPLNAIERVLSPSTLTEEAAQTGTTIRAGAGKLAQDTAQATEALKGYRKTVNALPDDARLSFIDAIESGAEQPTAELQPIADTLRKALDERKAKIQSLGSGYLESAVENYFPHIWDMNQVPGARPALEGAQAAAQAKSPFKGSGAFLKERVFDTVREGIEAGYKPLTTDPIDLTLIKLRELDKFYYGEQTLRTLDQDGLIKRVKMGERAPAGWVPLNDPSVSRLPHKTYAPPEVARVFNNYTSKGLVGEPLYDGIRYAGNALNQMQLGLSFFHAAFTSMDTMISEVARGLERASRGEMKGAAKSIASGFSPTTSLSTAIKGNRLREAYLNPQDATPAMQRMVNALTEGGGRIAMDQFYAASPSRGFVSSLRDGSLVNEMRQAFRDKPVATALKAPFDLATRAIRDISHPVMEWLVPRQKLGTFYNLAEDWMRTHPNAGPAEMRTAMQTIWDSVDNRLGQMVYDNVFWNKVQKDLLFIGVRSVGWNLGTIRELGGSAVDSARFIAQAAKGAKPEFTHRMAYAIAMPMVTAFYGAVINYLYTGEAPREARDYFFPRTGRLTEKGDEERVTVPSYIKDVLEYERAPLHTLASKAHPLIGVLTQLSANEDFYGALIRDPQHDFLGQVGDYAKYAGKQVLPFSIRSAQQQRAEAERMGNEDPGIGPYITSTMGLQRSPGFIISPERTENFERRKETLARRKAIRNEALGR
jgi:hypothetical protein